MEEYILSDYYNPVNNEQDTPIQEDQEYIEIPGVNEISNTYSTASNVIISEINSPSINIGAYNESKIIHAIFQSERYRKNTKKVPTTIFWDEKKKYTKKYIHNMVSQTSDNT